MTDAHTQEIPEIFFSTDFSSGTIQVGHELEQNLIEKNIEEIFESIFVLKEEPSRRVFVGVLASGEKIFCKHYREYGLLPMLRRWLVGSRGELGHKSSKRFVMTGLNTPLSLGYALARKGTFSVDSLHFTRYFDSSRDLYDHLVSKNADANQTGSILSDLAGSLARLHAQGYVHGDTKLKNILLDQGRLVFVDLDGFHKMSGKFSDARDIARVIVGLAEVNFSNMKLQKFMDDYCKVREIDGQALLEKIIVLVHNFQQKHKIKYGREPIEIVLVGDHL